MAEKKPKPQDFGLFEFGFDQDFSQEQLENLLKVFPSEEIVIDNIMKFREGIGYTDMKRGELYPEVIGSVQRLRRTIAKAYNIDIVQSQPNFACNGCIDALMTYIKISYSVKYIEKQKKYIKNLKQSDTGTDRNEHANSLIDDFLPSIIVAVPTYFRYYSATESKQIKMLRITFNDDYSFPYEQILDGIYKNKPEALVICTPNNPTGMAIPDNILIKILNETPEDLIIAVDRTCANTDKEISTEKLLKDFSNKRLVIFHSFSKYYSMSHIRIGFSVFANKEFAIEIEKMLPFGLNLEGALKATKILSDGPLRPSKEILDRIRSNQEIFKDFENEFKGYSLTPFTSNYALMYLPDGITSQMFSETLLKEGIFVMPGHQTPEVNTQVVRIHTGGEPKQTLNMLKVIKEKIKV